MRTLLYLFAEVIAVYLVLVGLSAIFIYGRPGTSDLDHLLMIGMAVVAVPGAVRLATIGNRHSLWSGFYRPVRPLAHLLPAFLGPRRESFAFTYDTDRAFRSYDVVEALARKLGRMGIAFDYAGGLRVEDKNVVWWIEPEFGENKLTGWVESTDKAHRAQIIGGVRDFLEQDVRVRIV